MIPRWDAVADAAAGGALRGLPRVADARRPDRRTALGALPAAGSAARAGREGSLRTRHVPQRTCVVCGAKAAKQELVRVVRTPDGVVDVDLTSKRNGRGAYVCRRRECWGSERIRHRLARALRAELAAVDSERLAAFAATLGAAEAPTG